MDSPLLKCENRGTPIINKRYTGYGLRYRVQGINDAERPMGLKEHFVRGAALGALRLKTRAEC